MNRTLTLSGLSSALVCTALLTLIGTPAVQAGARTKAESTEIPTGTPVTLTLAEPLSSEQNHTGDLFRLFVAEPVVINGRVVVRAGTPVTGSVTVAKPCGRLARQGRLGLELAPLRLGNRVLPIQALHGAPHPKAGFHQVLHGVTSPVRDLTNNVIAGLGDTPPAPQVVPVALRDRAGEQATVKTDVMDTGALERVELPAASGEHLARRGLAGLERVGTNTVNVLFGGPLGVFKRGASIDVPAGTTIHAVIALPDRS